MRKAKKKTEAGIVDLNQARLEDNEISRPSVLPCQKVPSPKNTNTVTNTGDSKKMPTINKENKKIKPIGNIANFDKKKNKFIERDENGKVLITRRNVIFGAIGAGVIVAGAAGTKIVTDKVNNDFGTINTLEVPKTNVINSDTLTEIPNSNLEVVDEFTLPYGSLAWANSSNIVTCLIPNDTAKPLTRIEMINMNTGNQFVVIEGSIGQKEGFEIYDARANNNGIIWTEVNILQGEWRIYVSKLDSNFNINPVLIDKGNSEWETPTIAVSENYAYWQVLPLANSDKKTFLSSLKKIPFGQTVEDSKYTTNVSSNTDIKDNPYIIYTSNGRMSTPVYSYNNGVVITPRTDTVNVHYELTYLDNNGQIIDQIALPQNMKPLEAGYGNTGFNFSFDAIYNYGEGISNLGTYTPLTKGTNYSDLKWLNFIRVPSAAPAWYNEFFVIRSTLAVCLLDLTNQTYSVLDRPNASDDYGDYLASSGQCERIVTYANIYDKPVIGEEKKYCSLRIWT